MKIAEALIERADLQRKLKELAGRIANSVTVQEGDTPQEDATLLLKDFEGNTVRLEGLVVKINQTNTATTIPIGSFKGYTLMQLLAKRDTQAAIRNQYLAAFNKALGVEGADKIYSRRYSRNEIKDVVVVSVSDLKSIADRAAKLYREIDTRVQELNWATELLA